MQLFNFRKGWIFVILHVLKLLGIGRQPWTILEWGLLHIVTKSIDKMKYTTRFIYLHSSPKETQLSTVRFFLDWVYFLIFRHSTLCAIPNTHLILCQISIKLYKTRYSNCDKHSKIKHIPTVHKTELGIKMGFYKKLEVCDASATVTSAYCAFFVLKVRKN